MNQFRTLTLAVALVLGTSIAAFGQSSTDTATSNADATVVSAIAIANTSGLNFGQLVAGASAGTVVMSTAGARSATGGATLGNAGSASAAAFNVTGDDAATFSITLPTSITIVDGAANSMTVDTFTSDPSGTGTLTAGAATVNVGATLNVDVTQVSGAYTGTFDVTAAYN